MIKLIKVRCITRPTKHSTAHKTSPTSTPSKLNASTPFTTRTTTYSSEPQLALARQFARNSPCFDSSRRLNKTRRNVYTSHRRANYANRRVKCGSLDLVAAHWAKKSCCWRVRQPLTSNSSPRRTSSWARPSTGISYRDVGSSVNRSKMSSYSSSTNSIS